VAVEKLPSEKFAKNKIASGCRINDVRDFQRHFLSPKFGRFGGKTSFSTPTGNFTNNKVGTLLVRMRYYDSDPPEISLYRLK